MGDGSHERRQIMVSGYYFKRSDRQMVDVSHEPWVSALGVSVLPHGTERAVLTARSCGRMPAHATEQASVCLLQKGGG